MKQTKAAEWMSRLWRSRSGRISHQILQEYYVTVTRKLRPALPVTAARDDVRALAHWNPVVVDRPLIEHAWMIEEKFDLAFWDSLVVAAASFSGASVLLTEDLQEGADLDGVLIVNPFRSSPEETIHDR